jgi:predicted dehydrogenase
LTFGLRSRRLSTINSSQTTTARKLRIAIIGCGKIADQHVLAIRRVGGCEIVATCDVEHLMAQQLGERFGISVWFSDVSEMLESMRPDVVHVTTPPQSHFALAKRCLEFGTHVYLEKPFTVTGAEAESLIQFAKSRNLKITAGHNYQFTPEMLEIRRLVREGFLGGKPIHVESYWSYDLADASYVRPITGNRNHWVRRLPGQLFHNVISHGIARLAEFLDDDIAELHAIACQSEQLKKLGAKEMLDELRVSIRDRSGATAFFCFSTQIKGLNQLRCYGPAGSLLADAITGTIIRNEFKTYKSYLTYIVPPINSAREHFRNATRNIASFLRQRLYQDFGMTELIGRFYRAIRFGAEGPIPDREIIVTAQIMDQIFSQIQVADSTSGDCEANQRSASHLPEVVEGFRTK